jgi:hypothetical protein
MNTQTAREVLRTGFRSEGHGHVRDPQWELRGVLIEGPTSDQIEFDIHLLKFTLTCVATIPEEGLRNAPVYLRHHPVPSRVLLPNEVMPEEIVPGRFWEGRNSNCILFSFDIMLFRFFCIVSIPDEGKRDSTIYVAHKILPELPRQ